MEPLTELNEGGEVCEYGGELHLGYIEFEVPVGFTSGDVGNIYSSDDQEGDMGTLGNVREKRSPRQELQKMPTCMGQSGVKEKRQTDTIFSLLPAASCLPSLALAKVEWSQNDL